MIIAPKRIVGNPWMMVAACGPVRKCHRYDGAGTGQQPARIGAECCVAGKIIHAAMCARGNPSAVTVDGGRVEGYGFSASERHGTQAQRLGTDQPFIP